MAFNSSIEAVAPVTSRSASGILATELEKNIQTPAFKRMLEEATRLKNAALNTAAESKTPSRRRRVELDNPVLARTTSPAWPMTRKTSRPLLKIYLAIRPSILSMSSRCDTRGG
jgi:hypothetical protein